jgi:hypothetical protein
LIAFGVFVGTFAASDVAVGMDLDPISFVSMPFRCTENKQPKKKRALVAGKETTIPKKGFMTKNQWKIKYDISQSRCHFYIMYQY